MSAYSFIVRSDPPSNAKYKMVAADELRCPDGIGRVGWFILSLSTSYMSFSTKPDIDAVRIGRASEKLSETPKPANKRGAQTMAAAIKLESNLTILSRCIASNGVDNFLLS
jgi:hypothetical protein|tara:strand:+ start:608 stop:940 length:333 start_codon:yes stop_codon:yes gene_type:complete